MSRINKVHSLPKYHDYLFVYGKLQPMMWLPKGTLAYQSDQVEGQLYDLGEDAAGVEHIKSGDWFSGYTLIVPENVLLELDKSEAPQYKRIYVETKEGYNAWMYEFSGKMPSTARRVYSWIEKSFMKGK